MLPSDRSHRLLEYALPLMALLVVHSCNGRNGAVHAPLMLNHQCARCARLHAAQCHQHQCLGPGGDSSDGRRSGAGGGTSMGTRCLPRRLLLAKYSDPKVKALSCQFVRDYSVWVQRTDGRCVISNGPATCSAHTWVTSQGWETDLCVRNVAVFPSGLPVWPGTLQARPRAHAAR
jgi:hypothetical protein